jgi:hypothetical protein
MKKPRTSREMGPATTTMAKGFCVSLPTPVDMPKAEPECVSERTEIRARRTLETRVAPTRVRQRGVDSREMAELATFRRKNKTL